MRIFPIRPTQLTDPRLPEILLDVRAVRVSMLIRGRNAWHGSWVRHYQGETAMFTEAASAKSEAESLRGPGNVFYVNQVPALLLGGIFTHLVLVDFHPDDPFGRYQGHRTGPAGRVLVPGSPLAEVLASFQHRSPHWTGPTPSQHSLRPGDPGLETENLLPLDDEPLGAWKSFAQGARYRLGWEPVVSRFRVHATRDLVSEWERTVSGIPGYRDRLAHFHQVDAEPVPRDATAREHLGRVFAEALDALTEVLPQPDR